MKPVDTFVSKGRIYHHQCSWSSRAQIAGRYVLTSVYVSVLFESKVGSVISGSRIEVKGYLLK